MNVLTVCMVPTVCSIVLASKYYTTKVAHCSLYICSLLTDTINYSFTKIIQVDMQ